MRRIILLSLATALASACSKQNCTVANCQALVQQCKVLPESDASSFCSEAVNNAGGNLDVDAGSLFDDECVRACERVDEGDFMACAAPRASMCQPNDVTHLEQNRQAAFAPCVKSSDKETDPTCYSTCYQAFRTCVFACPSTTVVACMPCGDTCAQTFVDCKGKCPQIPVPDAG